MQREVDLVTKRMVREQVLTGLLSHYPEPPRADVVAGESQHEPVKQAGPRIPTAPMGLRIRAALTTMSRS